METAHRYSMGINSYADIIHQNTSWVIAGNWWMRDGVEKSVFIRGKLNHRPPLCSVPSIYIFIWLKHLYQYFGSLDTVRKSFLNEAADFNVCMWVSEHKKKKKMIALCIMAVILQSKCYQMSNQVPNLPVSIDVRLMNIKTVSWLSFFFSGLYSEFTACIVHQISGTNFKEWCKWTSH